MNVYLAGPYARTIYIAGPYGARDQLRVYRDELRASGARVTSSWLDEDHEITAGTQGAATALSDEAVLEHASLDLREIECADVLILFTAAYVGCEGGGGRHVETGYAIAHGVPVIVVGEPENVFHRLGRGRRVAIADDWHRAKPRTCGMSGPTR